MASAGSLFFSGGSNPLVAAEIADREKSGRPGDVRINDPNKTKKTRLTKWCQALFVLECGGTTPGMCAENLQGRFCRHHAALGPFVNGRSTCRNFKTVRIECI